MNRTTIKPRSLPSTYQVIQIAQLIAQRNPDCSLSVESFFDLCCQIVPYITKLEYQLQSQLDSQSPSELSQPSNIIRTS